MGKKYFFLREFPSGSAQITISCVSLKLKQMEYLRAFHPACFISNHLPSGGGTLRNTKSGKLSEKL